MKTWTYDELTEKAESEIKRLMQSKYQNVKDSAFGAYMLWYNITVGWQKDGDAEKMVALTKEMK